MEADRTQPVFRTILLATDGSSHATAAWRYALDIARAYQAQLSAISVVDSRVLEHVPSSAGGMRLLEEDSAYSVEADAAMTARQDQALREVQAETVAAGAPVRVMLERGDPG